MVLKCLLFSNISLKHHYSQLTLLMFGQELSTAAPSTTWQHSAQGILTRSKYFGFILCSDRQCRSRSHLCFTSAIFGAFSLRQQSVQVSTKVVERKRLPVCEKEQKQSALKIDQWVIDTGGKGRFGSYCGMLD